MKPLLAGILAIVLMVGWSPGISRADTVTSSIRVDDAFAFYLSTSDSVAGTYIGNAYDWSNHYNFETLLTPNVTNYLHVIAYNSGGATGFDGNFTLSGTNFYFANGAQTLTTDLTNWNVAPYITNDPAVTYFAPIRAYHDVHGGNGFTYDPLNPPPSRFGQTTDAPITREGGIWIIDDGYWDHPAVAYFSSPIYATPEPSTYALLCISLGVVGYARRKMGKGEA
jgi:PEP-CTERM motif